jgi:hypothetical protein
MLLIVKLQKFCQALQRLWYQHNTVALQLLKLLIAFQLIVRRDLQMGQCLLSVVTTVEQSYGM